MRRGVGVFSASVLLGLRIAGGTVHVGTGHHALLDRAGLLMTRSPDRDRTIGSWLTVIFVPVFYHKIIRLGVSAGTKTPFSSTALASQSMPMHEHRRTVRPDAIARKADRKVALWRHANFRFWRVYDVVGRKLN